MIPFTAAVTQPLRSKPRTSSAPATPRKAATKKAATKKAAPKSDKNPKKSLKENRKLALQKAGAAKKGILGRVVVKDDFYTKHISEGKYKGMNGVYSKNGGNKPWLKVVYNDSRVISLGRPKPSGKKPRVKTSPKTGRKRKVKK